MVAASRGRPRDLIGELRRSPQRFRFFQAVRLLALADPDSRRPDSPLPANLRFRTLPSLAFPASEITAMGELLVEDAVTDTGQAAASTLPIDEENPPGQSRVAERRLEVACLGLTGPLGALPTPYTELLVERRVHYRDDSAHAFFDLFSHRGLALFYAAWRKYRFHLAHEHGNDDSFSRGLRALTGVGLAQQATEPAPAAHTPEEPAVGRRPPASALLYYAGLLARRPVSASAIVTLVRGFFDVPAELQQFVGQWIAIPPAEQSRLGSSAAILGESACAGQRAWDAQTKCRLRLGPLTASRYRDFLPGNPGAEALGELLRFCVGHNMACDLQLSLAREEVPAPQLASANDHDVPRLGQTLWLTSGRPTADPDHAVFSLLA